MPFIVEWRLEDGSNAGELVARVTDEKTIWWAAPPLDAEPFIRVRSGNDLETVGWLLHRYGRGNYGDQE